MKKNVLLIGNTDGIGLSLTKRLLAEDWRITGISRSDASIDHPDYRHHVADVSGAQFPGLIEDLTKNIPFDLCVYCAGIGELLDPQMMSEEIRTFEVNLMGLVRTASAVIPTMVRQGAGHFIGISSFADELLSSEAPSYHASKAGFSNYLESLALALKPQGVYVTNVRFGFVDTKMAKGDVRPLMMPAARAVDHIVYCMRRKPVRYSAPKAAVPLVKFRRLMMRLGL